MKEMVIIQYSGIKDKIAQIIKSRYESTVLPLSLLGNLPIWFFDKFFSFPNDDKQSIIQD